MSCSTRWTPSKSCTNRRAAKDNIPEPQGIIFQENSNKRISVNYQLIKTISNELNHPIIVDVPDGATNFTYLLFKGGKVYKSSIYPVTGKITFNNNTLSYDTQIGESVVPKVVNMLLSPSEISENITNVLNLMFYN